MDLSSYLKRNKTWIRKCMTVLGYTTGSLVVGIAKHKLTNYI